MPIVPGNDQGSGKKSGGSLVGWLVFLLVFGRPLYGLVRSVTNGRISDQQLLIITGGVVALIAVGVIVQRVNRMRASGTSTLSTPYLPPSNPATSLRQLNTKNDPSLPATPTFEPIITGKVVLAGIVLALLLIGGGLALLLSFS